MNNLDNLAHLLRDPQAILQTLEKAQVKLHSTSAGATRGGLTFGVHAPKPADADAKALLTLASNRLTEQKEVIKNFNDAADGKREEMLQTEHVQLKLFSIIFEYFRPGPAFRASQLWLPGAFAAVTEPGGPSWDSIISGKTVAQWGRHAVRLDNAANGHRGSGTVMSDGRILTARHVIGFPGFLFGSPASQQAAATARFNHVVNGADADLAVSGFAPLPTEDYCWINAPAQAPAGLGGLVWQTTPMTASEIKAKKFRVAVIGHPAPPSPAEEKVAALVYGEADMEKGYKRLMPGLLHPDNPLVEIDGTSYLLHDCSTVAGASGACLIDLDTGTILGVHVSGKSPDGSEDRNRAVPAWLINPATLQLILA